MKFFIKNTLYIVYLVFLKTSFVFAQNSVQAIIVDAKYKSPIPFATVRIIGTYKGTHANEEGYFKITDYTLTDSIIFSSVGYQSQVFSIKQIADTIQLHPERITLNEVIVSPQKQQIRNINKGNIKRSKLLYGASSGYVWEVAHFEAYKTHYGSTPFIKEIKFRTSSQIRGAKLKLKLYSLDNTKQTLVPLLSTDIIIKVKKGNSRVNSIDMSSYNIIFPNNGLFVAFEWIDNASNWLENEVDLGYKKELSRKIEPLIYTSNNSASNSNKLFRIRSNQAYEMDANQSGLAVEIILTN